MVPGKALGQRLPLVIVLSIVAFGAGNTSRPYMYKSIKLRVRASRYLSLLSLVLRVVWE
jgi:hypothetical protein